MGVRQMLSSLVLPVRCFKEAIINNIALAESPKIPLTVTCLALAF